MQRNLSVSSSPAEWIFALDWNSRLVLCSERWSQNYNKNEKKVILLIYKSLRSITSMDESQNTFLMCFKKSSSHQLLLKSKKATFSLLHTERTNWCLKCKFGLIQIKKTYFPVSLIYSLFASALYYILGLFYFCVTALKLYYSVILSTFLLDLIAFNPLSIYFIFLFLLFLLSAITLI